MVSCETTTGRLSTDASARIAKTALIYPQIDESEESTSAEPQQTLADELADPAE